VNWLWQTWKTFDAKDDTLEMAVGILNRYLNNEENILKNEIQLIGLTCLFIAQKYEEIY
jgi:hypothetical protein